MDLFFQRGTETFAIRVTGKELYFSRVQGHWVKYAGIEGLKLSVPGILLEFPDLKGKDDDEIKLIGRKRFIEHIKSLRNEWEILLYLKEDMAKHGYELVYYTKKGHRPTRVKDVGIRKHTK